MRVSFNYKHLYYFWVVAKEGGISRAAQKLDMAVQTVSAQVRELEATLGYALLKPAGRGLVLTEAGVAAMHQADQIFLLGENLPSLVRDAAGKRTVRLSVGISDGLPKTVVHRLLEPVIAEASLRLLCHEDEFADLLGDLALHRLDLVLADRQAPANPNIKLYTHDLGSSAMVWYASPALCSALNDDFPANLNDLPMLLPTDHAAVRHRLDHWLQLHGVHPRIVGEFEDSALLAAFGARGMGVFPAVEWVADELRSHHGLVPLGPCEGVYEQFFAIGTERKVHHPLVLKLLHAQR